MAATTSGYRLSSSDLRLALIITRREVRDALRDWRIVIPILLLTLGFPLLMNVAAERIIDFVTRYDSEVIGDRLIPLLLMIVGFFPTSFSLVIALETFVGEKERKSLEPLLATPLTNTQLYLGKMLASLVPPLGASFLGITVYTIGIYSTLGPVLALDMLLLVVALTTVQAVIMVAGAVVVSSQTTSVRAANLLASFIIVPMALLIQFEAAMMFWGNQTGLWLLVAALVIVAGVLVRMGVALFNREELLGRDIDGMRLGWALRQFWDQFSGRAANDGRVPGLRAWYRDLFRLLPALRAPFFAAVMATGGGLIVGAFLAARYPLPPELSGIVTSSERSESLAQLQLIAARLPLRIFGQNVRALAVGAILGVFSLGVGGLGVFMLPWAVVGYIGSQMAAGDGSLGFLALTLLPHGVVEYPALLLAAAAGLRWHTVFISASDRLSLSERWLRAGADFARVFLGLVLPLLLLAAFLEAYLTPAVLRAVFGS